MNIQEPKGSFIRWQAVTLAELTYAINLLLTFAVATLGYQVTLLGTENFSLTTVWQKNLFLTSLLCLSASIAFGLIVVVNRLRSFRATMHAARARENDIASNLKASRTLYEKLDSLTWCFFWWQVGTFAAGIALTVVSLLLKFWDKLI